MNMAIERCNNTKDRACTSYRQGSVSIEAIIGVTLFIAIVLTFVFMLRFIALNERVNQAVHDSVMTYGQLSYVKSKIDFGELEILKQNERFIEIAKALKLDACLTNTIKELLIQGRLEAIIYSDSRFKTLVNKIKINVIESNNGKFALVDLSYNIHFPFIIKKEITIQKCIKKRLWNGGNNPAYLRKLCKDDVHQSIYYITHTGSKYHLQGCIYLEKSSVPINLDEALEKNYTPCKICIINGGTGHENK